jgi:hypothetical protein
MDIVASGPSILAWEERGLWCDAYGAGEAGLDSSKSFDATAGGETIAFGSGVDAFDALGDAEVFKRSRRDLACASMPAVQWLELCERRRGRNGEREKKEKVRQAESQT